MSFNNKSIDSFNLIAPIYDLASDALTLRFHHLWRKALCKEALKNTPKNAKVLDLATGTGEVILELLQERSDLSVTGVDASQAMLQIAQKKINEKAKLLKDNVELKLANVFVLPFSNDHFDTVTVCFGLRSFKPYSAVLREIMRVLKPNGFLHILERGKPEFNLIRHFYRSWHKYVPQIGEKLSQMKLTSMSYTTSQDSFPSGSQFIAELYDSGFFNAKFKTFKFAKFMFLYSAQKLAN